MSKHKPGGLVIVLSKNNKQGVRGSIATLVRRAAVGYSILNPYNGRYRKQVVFEGTTANIWHVSHPVFGEWLHAEASLIPIDPDADKLTEEVSKELVNEL